MKKLLVWAMGLIIILSLIAGCGSGIKLEQKQGDYTITLSIKNKPVQGPNETLVTIRDKTGAAVKIATVQIQYDMPPMQGMPPMRYVAETQLKGDAYKAVLDMSMAGSWIVKVRITLNGMTQVSAFTLDV